MLVEALGSVFPTELRKSIFHGFILVLELPDFLFELGQLILLSLEQLFRSSNAFDLILFFLAGKGVQLTLVYLDELIDIVQFLFDQFELLVEVGRISFVGLRQLGLVEDLIDCLTQLV